MFWMLDCRYVLRRDLLKARGDPPHTPFSLSPAAGFSFFPPCSFRFFSRLTLTTHADALASSCADARELLRGSEMSSLPDALSALHDPSTTPAARHAAHVFCEQYKATAAARLAEILPLIHASQPLLSRHFGLHAVEGVLQSQWEQLSPDAQLELRRSLLSVARDGLLPLAQEAHMVREKLAVLLVGIARREWPARWTTMLPELVQLASAGNTPAHCVLLAMRTLIEDICSEDGDSWGGGDGGGSNGSASSATDPRSALDAAAPDMLEWMHQRLRCHLRSHRELEIDPTDF